MRPAECCTSHMWRHQCGDTPVVRPGRGGPALLLTEVSFCFPSTSHEQRTVLSHSCTDAERSHCPVLGLVQLRAVGGPWRLSVVEKPGILLTWCFQAGGNRDQGLDSQGLLLFCIHIPLWYVGKTNGPCSQHNHNLCSHEGPRSLPKQRKRSSHN